MSFAQQKTPNQYWREAHCARMAVMMVTGESAVEGTVRPEKISCRNERELGATVSLTFMLFFTALLSNYLLE